MEKARIMATLNTPDDAFDRVRFDHGTKRCNGEQCRSREHNEGNAT